METSRWSYKCPTNAKLKKLQVYGFLPQKITNNPIFTLEKIKKINLEGKSINAHEGWFEALTKPTLFKLPRKVLMNFYYLPDH